MRQVDLVIVGAGMSGIYMLYKAKELGLSVVTLEAGEGVGGAWFWNRYPGCRCDVNSIEYSYSFSKELQQEWNWSERMAAQPEIERYLNHVVNCFDLRPNIEFKKRVKNANYSEDAGQWLTETEDGEQYNSKFIVLATGSLSVPFYPDIPGIEKFEGDIYHTATWPDEKIDFSDKRVAVVGSGSSGVQLVQTIAPETKSLTAFQRSPAYTFPANNKSLSEAYMNDVKAHYDEIRQRQRTSFDGLSWYEPAFDRTSENKPSRKILELSPEERQKEMEEFGSIALLAYVDVHFNEEADKVARELYRENLFKVVKDPVKAAKLMPKNTPIRCKRQILDTNYYEAFNLPHVDIVALKEEPIIDMTKDAVITKNGQHDIDVFIYATGFDAVTGPVTRIDIRNAEGKSIAETWEENGIESYLGLQIAGFPNIFTVTGLGSPSVLSNLAFSIEYHVNWISECIAYLRDNNYKSIQPAEGAQEAWTETVSEAVKGRMAVAPSCNSWYLGSNIPGKQRRFLVYTGGCDTYDKHCKDAVANGYQMFQLEPQ